MSAAALESQSGEISSNGNGLGPTYVGIWYCTYYGDDW